MTEKFKKIKTGEGRVWQNKYEPYIIDETIDIDLSKLPKHVQYDLEEWTEIVKEGDQMRVCAFSSVIASDFYQMSEFDEVDGKIISKLWAKYLNNRF